MLWSRKSTIKGPEGIRLLKYVPKVGTGEKLTWTSNEKAVALVNGKRPKAKSIVHHST